MAPLTRARASLPILSFISLIAILCVRMVHADLPVHCLNLNVAGAWTFSLSTNAGDAVTTTCGYLAPDSNAQHFEDPTVFDFDVASTYQVVLKRPATAYDADGNVGTWTMIYDEGFEVRINGKVFFAFMSYSPNSGVNTGTDSDVTSYTSDCSKTMTGWFRDADNSNWGCWSGAKYTATSSSSSSALEASTDAFSWVSQEDLLGGRQSDGTTQASLETQFVTADSTKTTGNVDIVFTPDPKYVARVNMDKRKTWRAKVHKGLKGKKVSQLLSLSSSGKSRAHMHASLAAARPATAVAPKKSNKYVHNTPKTGRTLQSSTSLPDAFDWRNVDGVNYDSPVVSQGSCGSCYAVATKLAYEARWRVASNNTLQPIFSAQEIISCSITNQGCEGGFPFLAAKHGFEQGFILESDFTYDGVDEPCAASAAKADRYKLSAYGYIGGYYGASSEELMMEEIYANGPIVIAFECPTAMFYYDGGVFDGECSMQTEDEESDVIRRWEATNHAVVALGWGVADGLKYWIMKNTWGASWGESGYFRIARGVDECATESMTVHGTPVLE